MSPAPAATRHSYRIVLQLDRGDDDVGFDDPVEVWTGEEQFALAAPPPGDAAAGSADDRGRSIMGEINAAIAAVLARRGAERAP